MEYIEREAAIEKLNKLCDRVCQYSKAQRKYMCGACPLRDAFTVIEDDFPAADVRPAVRGHKVTHNRPIAGYWASGKLDGGWDGMEGRVWVEPIMDNPVDYCSECGKRLDDTFQNFCPNCGADMREES